MGFGIFLFMKLIAKVIKGRGLGKELGFPTLNFSIPKKIILDYGVYVCRMKIPLNPPFERGESDPNLSGEQGGLNGVLFFGPRHSTDSKKTLEVHLLDIKLSETPTEAIIEVLEKIREVKKFANYQELAQAIQKDCETARKNFLQ